MKISFENHSYIEVIKSDQPGKIIITIAARDATDPLTVIANSVELTVEQFKQLTNLE